MKYRIIEKGGYYKIQYKSILFWYDYKMTIQLNGGHDYEFSNRTKWFDSLQQAKNMVKLLKEQKHGQKVKSVVVWED